MPDQPKIPLPEWVPPELESQFRDFGYNSQAELAQLSEKDRGVLLNLMQKQAQRKHWVQGIDKIKAGEGHVPQDQIDHYFDRDVKPGEKSHGWGPDWKASILRHPKTDLTPEVLNEIANNKAHTPFVQAAAWMHPKANGPLPENLNLSDFASMAASKQVSTVPDERLAQIVSHGAQKAKDTHLTEGGYPYLPVKDSYDAVTFARNLIEDNNRRNGGVKPITAESHPQTVEALIDYPQATVQQLVAQNLKLDDKHVNRLLAAAQPTLKGQPVTDEHKEYLNRDLNNNPTGNEGTDGVIEGLQNDFYKENEKKDRILRALAYNQHLTSPQVDALANVAARTQEIGRPTGAYDHKVAQRIASHPNISSGKQFELLSNPYDFIEKAQHDYEINRDKKSGRYRSDEAEPAMMKPDVFNDHFPAMLSFFKEKNELSNNWEHGSHINAMLEHPHISPENIKWTYEQSKKDLAEKGKTSLAWPTLLNHPHTSEEIKRDMWHQLWNPTPKEQERLYHNATEEGKTNILSDRARRFGIQMLEGGKIPNDLATDIVKRTEIMDANLPNLGPEHHRIMLDKAKALQFSGGAHNDNQHVLESVARNTTDPQLIREAHQHLKAWDWDPNDAVGMYKEGDRREKNDLAHLYEPFNKNPNTPSDVISKIHDDFPSTDLMDHPNFPQERMEHYADMPEGKLPSIDDEWNRNEARSRLKDVDPDKYSYKTGGPGTNMTHPQKTQYEEDRELQAQVNDHLRNGGPHPDDIKKTPTEHPGKGQDFGRTHAKMGMSKLRVFRDKILEADPARGELSPKQLGQGPFGGNWKPVQEKNGNISAKKIQEFIDSQPSQEYNFSHEPWSGAQRHSKHDQRVFKLNVTSDHIKRMKEAGVYGAFKKLSQYSEDSGHPSDAGHTLGWVRYEHHQNPKTPEQAQEEEKAKKKKRLAPFVEPDPVDALMGQMNEAQAQGRNPLEKPEQEFNTDTDKPEHIHVDEIQSDMGHNLLAKLRENPDRAKQYGVEPDQLETAQKIVFGDHHPSEVLMEAFRQHHRDQGRANVPIHILDSKTKAPISGQETDLKKLPAHMQFTYTQMPKKMGMQPAKYGDTAQQDNPEHANLPTWTDKIRKFEEELINKALADIKPGPETHAFPRSKQNRLPEQVGSGRRNWHDYNHVLSPQQKKAGYQLYVRHTPDTSIFSALFHKGQPAGAVQGIINPLHNGKLRVDSGAVEEKHRGKGLGTAMYEAMLAHARHSGIQSVRGSSHSTMAHGVHNKLSAKHGLTYSALPNYMEGSYQHWPDEQSWAAAPTGAFDDKYGQYEYMIKADEPQPPKWAKKNTPFRSAAFKHKQTGQIVETGPHHDIMQLPGGEDTFEDYIDGFMGHDGNFYDRDQAAQKVKLGIKESPKPTGETYNRTWLDSFDPEAGMWKSEDGIKAMLESPDPTEKILALKSALTMPHHVLMAINDPDPTVRSFAATHPMINGPLLMECLRQCKSPDAFELLLGHESCDDTHMNYALETDWGGNGGPEDDGEPL